MSPHRNGTASWRDLEIALDDRPGALAEMGEALGRAGVSLEGGGVFVVNGGGVAHFLVADADAARSALAAAGIRVVAEHRVVRTRLRQGEPGQLGALARRLADAGVNIAAQYSDHDHHVILVVDDTARAEAAVAGWADHEPGA